MKFNNITNGALIVFVALISASCKTNTLPRVSSPTYQPYSFGDEKGYNVEFELNKGNAKPTAVVINRIKQNINTDANKQNHYKIKVIVETRRIFGHKVQVVDKLNGIYFKTDSSEVFKEVDFRIKTN